MAGSYLALRIRQQQIKAEVKAHILSHIDEDELVSLKFRTGDQRLIWEHDREFEFEGVMYDIVSEKNEGDSTRYLVYPDHDESRVKKKLNRIIADYTGNDSEHNEQQKRLYKFFKSLFFQHEQLKALVGWRTRIFVYEHPPSRLVNWQIFQVSPPPEFQKLF